MLDFKDAFFYIPIDEQALLLFAFKWPDPTNKTSTQYHLTVLAQDFKNFPLIFGELLARDLRDLEVYSGILSQYIDDLLITWDSYEVCLENTINVLNHLASCGDKFSPHKAQNYK